MTVPTISHPSPLDHAAYAARVVSILAPSLAYRSPRPDGAQHRAEVAAQRFAAGACSPTDTPYLWQVQGLTQGRAYLVDIDGLVCECQDSHRRHGMCWHLLAAAMAEAQTTRCPTCAQTMEHVDKFAARRDRDGDRYFVGAQVCDACGIALLDNGEIARREVAA